MEIVGDKYRLKELIGQGGMASVFRAWDLQKNRFVALKKVHSHLSSHGEIRGRFHFEAKVISEINHKNIVKFLDYSGENTNDLWIVMELLEGSDLVDYIDRSHKGYLSSLHSILILNDVAEALKEVHKKNIIHRDIKPENIMVLHNSEIKLMDFGIAKDIHLGNLTQVGDFLGSPNYMSPEQIRGTELDKKSDIYSLGVLLYRMLTGELPFDGYSHHELCMKILLGDYIAPNEISPGMNPILLRIVTRCLALKTHQRYQSVDELLSDIRDYLVLSQDKYFREKSRTVLRRNNSKQRA